tara:strand:+ start:2227 stop:4074 length:1848 start_codon:yes stop_codon:yes gene_type:complete
MQTTILIQNGKTNPNEFNVKLGSSLNIPPNSEICVNKIKIQKDRNITIDSTNNHFLGYFGNPLDMPVINANTAGYSEFPYLPPQHFYIKSGTHNLVGNIGLSPVVQYDSSDDNRSNNLCSILVDTLNEQNIYKMWGFAGKYINNIDFGLTPYLRNHTISNIDWVKNNLFQKNLNITIQPKNVGVTPAMNLLSDEALSGGVVSANGIPFPYSYNVKPNGNLDDPQAFHDIILPTYTVGNAPRTFGGIILEQQHTYRENEPYNINKDWIGDDDSAQFIDEILNQIPITWEIEPSTNEVIFKIHFIDDSETSLVSDIIETGIIYDGTVEIYISIVPKLTSLNNLGVQSTLTRQRIEFWAGPAAGFVLQGFHDLDESYFNYQWKHAIFLKSKPAEILTIKFFGVDNSLFINDIAQSLGSIDDTNNIGNISFNIATEMIPQDTFLNQGPRVKTNYEFFKETQFLNAHFMSPTDNHIYNMGGDLNIGLLREIEIDQSLLEKVLILNIDNLPIKNYYCDNNRGYIQKRLYTLMAEEDLNQNIIEIPMNLNWVKLNNKSTITLNNLNIRWSNIDGSPTYSINGTCIIELILKENTSIRFRASNSNDKEYDNTENNFNLAQKVI